MDKYKKCCTAVTAASVLAVRLFELTYLVVILRPHHSVQHLELLALAAANEVLHTPVFGASGLCPSVL